MIGAVQIVTALRRSVSFHLPKYFTAKTLPSGTQWCYDYCPAGARIVSGDSPLNYNLYYINIFHFSTLKFIRNGFRDAGAAGFAEATRHMLPRLLGKLSTSENVFTEFVPQSIHRFIQA